MKNLFKYTFATLIGVLAMASCTNEYEYEPAPADNMGGNGYVKASEDGTTFLFTPDDEQNITFVVGRIDSTQAGSVSLTSDNGKVNVPATVSFAAGEGTKTVTATCNIEIGGNEKATVSVGDSDAFIYAQNAVTFSIQVFPVIEINYVFGLYGTDVYPWKVYDMGDGNYRLPAYGYDYDIDFTINGKNQIIVKPQPAWKHQTYGDVWVIGNYYGDANSNGKGSGLAGVYDPETGVGQIVLLHYVPELGSFSVPGDVIIFPVGK